MPDNLDKQFKEIGKTFNSVPHIILGDNKPHLQNPPGQPQEAASVSYSSTQEDLFSKKESNILNKFKKWGLIIAVIAVFGYAAYRIIA